MFFTEVKDSTNKSKYIDLEYLIFTRHLILLDTTWHYGSNACVNIYIYIYIIRWIIDQHINKSYDVAIEKGV